jgi:hypothetical protein
MNKNTRKRIAKMHKQMRKVGFPKPAFKKKVQPFPRPNPDIDLSIKAQNQMFHGRQSLYK